MNFFKRTFFQSISQNWVLHYLLGKHASIPYNPNIASVFYYACEEDGVPMPKYTVHPSDIMIKFTAPEERVVRVNDRVNDRVNEQEKKVLELLYEDPGFTVTVLAKRMNVSRKSIANYLKSLREKGLIERIGSDRKGYWKIKD